MFKYLTFNMDSIHVEFPSSTGITNAAKAVRQQHYHLQGLGLVLRTLGAHL
jgi:hypothetical protein